MAIKPKPLTPEAFAPYGQVLMGRGQGPERHAFAARIENRRAAAKPNMTFMRVALADTPIAIRALERHRFSHQVFVPLNGTRHLVAVCPSTADGEPDLSGLLVFTAEGSQAVNYDAGVWHAPRTALDGPGEFIMLRWDDGGDDDTEVRPLDVAIEIDFPA